MHSNNKIYDLQSLKDLLACSGRNIGLFGGSFNPAHNGHIAMSEYGMLSLHLDYVIWLVSPQNPFKPKYKKSLEERSNYAASIIEDDKILVSTMEVEIDSKYTFQTIEFFCSNFKHHNFTWMMGADCLESFHLWENYDKFMELVDIAIFDRPGYSYYQKNTVCIKELMKNHKHRIIFCKNELVNISSTEIRAKYND